MDSAKFLLWGNKFINGCKELGNKIADGAVNKEKKTKEGAIYAAQKTKEGAIFVGNKKIDSYNQIMQDITNYHQYCEEHPDFLNHQTDATIKRLKEDYQQRLEKNDFEPNNK